MCEKAHGEPTSPELDAAHSCGVRLCINPRHLRWATRAENMADAIEHGTTTRGERHGAHKLEEVDVREILDLLSRGETHESIAVKYGVSRNAITGIANQRNWSWLSIKRDDGTGRGTPLVPVAFQTRGSNIDTNGAVSGTLGCNADRASGGAPCIAYRVHGEHSTAMTGNGSANVADPVEVARCLDTCGGYSSNQGGNVIAQPVAFNWQGGGTQTTLGFDPESGVAGSLAVKQTPAIAFTCKDYGADAGDLSPTLRAMGHSGSHANAGGQVAVAIPSDEPYTLAIRGRGDSQLEYRQDGTANALLTPNGGRAGIGVGAVAFAQNTRDELRLIGGDGSVVGALAAQPGMKQQSFVAGPMAVRRITPEEAEKLQGFEPGYTNVPYRGKVAADGPRYRALGNSMAVPCMAWLGMRIQMVEDLMLEMAA